MPTFKEASEAYLRDRSAKTSAQTVRSQLLHLTFLNGVPLEKVDLETVETVISGLCSRKDGKPLKISTKNAIFSTVQAILRHAATRATSPVEPTGLEIIERKLEEVLDLLRKERLASI